MTRHDTHPTLEHGDEREARLFRALDREGRGRIPVAELQGALEAVGLGDFAARLSLRGYTRSVLSRVGGIDYGFDAYTTTTALVVLAAVSVAGLILAALRLNRLDVA